MKKRLAWAWLSLAAIPITMAGATAEMRPALEILGKLEAPAEGPNGIKIDELSGLAWDADEQLLYAVSDSGVLHHFRVRLEGTEIREIQPVFSANLAAMAGGNRPLVNAEGLAVLNGDNGRRSDSELLIALEDGPAVGRFTIQGEHIGDIALPDRLRDKSRYSGKNSRLESVAFDARRGALTAPETPMSGEPQDLHTLYAADGTTWSFKAFQPDRSDIKAVELLPDGNVLILERTRVEKGAPPVARLRYLDLASCTAGGVCRPLELSAPANAMLEDNFEGLARLSDNLFLIVTDRKGKDPESAVFVLFTVQTTP
jgi:hypothetical protein